MRFLFAAAVTAILSPVGLLCAADSEGPRPKPVITSAGVANAAGYTAGTVCAGEIIVVFGSDLGPAELTTLEVVNGFVASDLAGVQVSFDGVPAPLVYVSATQLSAIVPYAVAVRTSTDLTVTYNGVSSGPINLPVAANVPGIFTLDSSGRGQAAALNQDGTINSPTNPAQPGEVVVLFATGEGQTTPNGQDGWIVDPDVALPKPNFNVSVNFNGPADVLYAGAAPFLVSGVMQVNARIPLDNGPDLQTPVSLEVGRFTSQGGVTIAVIVLLKPLTAGGSVTLAGTTGEANPELVGAVLEDRLLPFELRDAGGSVVLSGVVQDRTSVSNSNGNVYFSPRIRDLDDHGSGAQIAGFSSSGFAGFDLSVEYQTDGSGTVGLRTATRSEDGNVVSFELDSPLGPPDETYFATIGTTAKEVGEGGEIVITGAMPDGAPLMATIPGAQAPR